MARKAATSTPASTPSLKKSASSGGQKTLLGFFQRTPSTSSPVLPPTATLSSPSATSYKPASPRSSSSLTPAPSSDPADPEDENDNHAKNRSPSIPKGLPSPVSADERQTNGVEELNARGTPTRRVCLEFNPSGEQYTYVCPRRKRKSFVTSIPIVKVPTTMMSSSPQLQRVLVLQNGEKSRKVRMMMYISMKMYLNQKRVIFILLPCAQ